MTSETARDAPDETTDWQGLSVIALAMSAWAIPIITGRSLGSHLSDPGVRGQFWICIGASAVVAAVASVRSIKIIRSRRSRTGMAWMGLSLSIPLLVLHVVSGIGTLLLWFALRDLAF